MALRSPFALSGAGGARTKGLGRVVKDSFPFFFQTPNNGLFFAFLYTPPATQLPLNAVAVLALVYLDTTLAPRCRWRIFTGEGPFLLPARRAL